MPPGCIRAAHGISRFGLDAAGADKTIGTIRASGAYFQKNLVCLHNSTTPPHKWVPKSSCGEIGTVGRPNRLKQSVFHRNLLVGMRLALAGDELGAAQVDHLGGYGDGDLLGVLGLDGNADRQVQLVDPLLRKALLLQAGAHKGRLAARA